MDEHEEWSDAHNPAEHSQVPDCASVPPHPPMKDSDVSIGEDATMIPYITLKYMQTHAYPEQDLAKTDMIDSALTNAWTMSHGLDRGDHWVIPE